MDAKSLIPPEKIDEKASIAKPRIRSPRPLWMEYLLWISSLGVFVCFWMVGRARDIKNASNGNQTPWLWFFVPFLSIASAFALPAMLGNLTDLEGDKANKGWQKWGVSWVVVLVFLSVSTSLVDRLIDSESVILAVLLVFILWFGFLHRRFNQWKENLQDVEFHGKPNGYQWYEWITLLFGGCVLLLLIFFTVIEPLMISKVKAVSNATQITDKETGYNFIVHGDGWTQVAVGSYGEDDAVYELDGPLYDNFFVVYAHGVDTTLNSVSSWREDSEYRFSNTPRCSATRGLSSEENSIFSATECVGRNFDDKVTTYSTLIEVDDQIVELYGHIAGKGNSYEVGKANMQKMTKSFVPIARERGASIKSNEAKLTTDDSAVGVTE